MTPPQGYFSVSSRQPAYSVTTLLGDGAPAVTGGLGGWSEIPRPRKVSLTEWQGVDPFKLSIPFILDGYADNLSVEGTIKVFEAMATVPSGMSTPPIVEVDGYGIPHTDLAWVISGIDWAQKELGPDNSVVRQAGTLNLLQYVEDELVIGTGDGTVGSTPATPAKVSWKLYTIKHGDTLQLIATRSLRKPATKKKVAHFVQLAKTKNKIRDPRKLPKAGSHIRIPIW